MIDATVRRLTLWHFLVAFAAFGLASLMGFYQVVERSGLIPGLQSAATYFASVSTHGVLMAYVLTIFFIMGFGYYTAGAALRRPLWRPELAVAGFWISAVGTVLAAVPLLTGNASVLYTFYPPLRAHPAFYIGATLLVGGSWLWCAVMLKTLYLWLRENPGQTPPLAMYATCANVILWAWTSAGVAVEVVFQLIPWSLGWRDTIDPGMARTLFAWTLHPIVYFWLIPAYTAFYVYTPQVAGGKLFSDGLARLSFMFLVIGSLPIGFHHLFMDPEQHSGWKLLHAVGTFAVSMPTLMTGFTVIASLEVAGRLRGGRGLFGWIGTLPWDEPMVLATILSFLMLLFGGFGGLVNASYAMNAMVHNTAWVPGHFHLIFAGTTVILYFAIAYHLWPKLTGRQLITRKAQLVQLWTWFVGITVLTTPWHILGLLGQPRRISSVTYNSLLTLSWQPYELMMIVGGLIMLVSAGLFLHNLAKSARSGPPATDLEERYAEPLEADGTLPPWLTDFKLWNRLIAALMAATFGYPLLQFFFIKTYGSTPWGH